jgi:hypothetical protein
MQRPAAHWLARQFRLQQPGVLVLSLPRSGSSWTGEALGAAANALYLREPVTQSDQAFYLMGTVFPLTSPGIEAKYRRLADMAYEGWPDFGSHVVRFPEQWTLRERRKRRIVVKEVNPLACQWYARRYHPHIVFLVRHPAAVALSWQSKGWLDPTEAGWAENGRVQGRALRAAFGTLAAYPAHHRVLYEDLCAEPVAQFRNLFEFAGLKWDAAAAAFLTERTTQEDGSNAWDTTRVSHRMIGAWRRKATPAHVAALRATYQTFGLDCYRDDADWAMEERASGA